MAAAATGGRGAPAIVVEGLTKSYGRRNAVEQLSFTVGSGSVCGFIGPNGAGKTTTLRMLLGLVRPTSGTARVFGHGIDRPGAYLHRVGSMIEGPAFYPTLSGRRNLDVLAALAGVGRDRVEVVLRIVGMDSRAGDLFRSYSLGMKQRIGIAAALLADPDVLILDEPTNGLDPPGIREVRDLVRGLADAGKAVLVSSHLLDELQHVCDQVVIINEGALVFEGSLEALTASRGPKVTAAPQREADLDRVAALATSGGYEAAVAGGLVVMSAPPEWAPELNRRAMAAGITLAALGVVGPSLEDVFFELTERGGS